jgi:hypothetical protein
LIEVVPHGVHDRLSLLASLGLVGLLGIAATLEIFAAVQSGIQAEGPANESRSACATEHGDAAIKVFRGLW